MPECRGFILKVTNSKPYIPALSFHSLTPFYDLILQWVMQEQRFKRLLVEQTQIRRDHYALDFGCGTGTLARMLKRRYPSAFIIGLDIDPVILAIAQRKAASLTAWWICASALELPFADDSYDRVVTSLVLHHLTTSGKQQAMAEIYRILRPHGQLHVIDFGPPHSLYSRAIAPLLRPLEEVADNLDGYLPSLFAQTGFNTLSHSAPLSTIFGDLYLYALEKPARPVGLKIV
jgi:ubiquinone/menaquinone biosynthesis C-methylase UbiE